MDIFDTSDEEESQNDCDFGLDITEVQAEYNYNLAGTEVPEPTDQISVLKYESLLLNDQVHQKIMEVLSETKLAFKLADFQLVSLHVLGNQRNLILVSPTGSGKMLGKYNIYLESHIYLFFCRRKYQLPIKYLYKSIKE